MRRFLLTIALALAAAPASSQTAQERVAWNKLAAPFHVAGNIYSIGTEGMAIYLITDPRGHIVLDAGFPETVPMIAANIEALGFRVQDVKYLINSHAHSDHAGGLAALKQLAGAQLVASAGDRPELEAGRVSYRESVPFPGVKVDRVVGEGDRLVLGDTVMTAHITPGHTRGCTSWSTRIEHRGRQRDVLFSCSLTVAGQPLVGRSLYPKAAADFRSSIAWFRTMHPDIFLANHPVFFDMAAKKARLDAGDPDAFVDRDALADYVAKAEAAFEEELARQQAADR
jgi:metallo-beta-lactamase class B